MKKQGDHALGRESTNAGSQDDGMEWRKVPQGGEGWHGMGRDGTGWVLNGEGNTDVEARPKQTRANSTLTSMKKSAALELGWPLM